MDFKIGDKVIEAITGFAYTIVGSKERPYRVAHRVIRVEDGYDFIGVDESGDTRQLKIGFFDLPA